MPEDRIPIGKIRISKERWQEFSKEEKREFIDSALNDITINEAGDTFVERLKSLDKRIKNVSEKIGVPVEHSVFTGDELVDIEVSEETVEKVKRISKEYGVSEDIIVDLALKTYLEKQEKDISKLEQFKGLVEPFDRLKNTINFNPMMLDKEASGYSAFQKFQQIVLLQYAMLLKGHGFFRQDFEEKVKKYEKYQEDGKPFPLINQIRSALVYSKIFNVGKELQEMIEHTDNKVYLRKTPFDNFFINMEIEAIKDVFVYGINVMDMKNVFNPTSEKVEEALFITCLGRDFRDESEFYTYFTINPDGIVRSNEYNASDLKVFQSGEIKEIEEKMAKIVSTFLDLLNHPDIHYEVVSHPAAANEHRYSKGKTRVPDKIDVYVKGKLHRYIYEDMPRIRRIYKNSFWVRGHYKHFRDKKRFVQIYKLPEDKLKARGLQEENGVIKKWTKPFLKGKGKIIQKEYSVRIKEDD